MTSSFRQPILGSLRCAVCAIVGLSPLGSFGQPKAGQYDPNAVVAPFAPALSQAAPTSSSGFAPASPSDAAPEARLSQVPEANGLLHLGANLAAHGDYATAEMAYRQILNRGDFSLNDQKSALLGLAHMFRKAGALNPPGLPSALTKAAAIYEKFLAQFPDDNRVPDAYLDLGRTLRDMGAYDLALNRFYSVINSTLKLPAQGFDHYSLLAKTAQFEIAQTYYQAGDYVQAGKFFARVRLLDLAPADRARAHFMVGCAQENAGDLDSAATTLRAYLEQWPKDENVPEARYMLATALRGLNRTQEAMAVTLDLLRGEQGRGAGDARRWNYWQRRTGNQLANSFFESGDMIDALTIYNYLAALSADPAWRLPILYQVALCYERLFQIDRARATYQAILDTAARIPSDANPSATLAELTEMSAWRMGQLGWHDTVNQRLTTLLAPGVRSPNQPKTANPTTAAPATRPPTS